MSAGDDGSLLAGPAGLVTGPWLLVGTEVSKIKLIIVKLIKIQRIIHIKVIIIK